MRKPLIAALLIAAPAAAALLAYGAHVAGGGSVDEGRPAALEQEDTAELASPLPSESGPPAWRVRRVGRGFNQPLFLAPVPDGTGRVFVVEQTGLIRILDPATGGIAPQPFLDISAEITTEGARGLLGIATAPDFATSRRFYISMTNLDGDSEIRAYRTRADNPDRASPQSADTILTFTQGDADNHKAGWIGFGADGYLYMTSGDGGPGGDPNNTAQDTSLLLGKVIRIDVAADQFPGDPLRDYTIPPDNPFAGGGGRPEIWAYGLRNPFRASFDRQTGVLYIGDVGQFRREEIDVMRPQDGGANFGWSILEGDKRFKPGDASGLVAPSIVYSNGTQPRQGESVTGGYVYRGPVAELFGLYFFADFVNGYIWTVPAGELEHGVTAPKTAFVNRTAQSQPDAGDIDLISSFGEDEAGNLYIVSIDGEIFRIEPKG